MQVPAWPQPPPTNKKQNTKWKTTTRNNEDAQKILKDMKEIGTSSPYDWIDYYIGEWYRKGWGGEVKKNQAVKWFENAVLKGNTAATCRIEHAYHTGALGLTQSVSKANELLTLAADKGNATARFNLGICYRDGDGDLTINFNRCVQLWEQSANQGYVEAQYDLGSMYQCGSEDGPTNDNSSEYTT